MRMIAALHKGAELKYVSHLDLLRTLQRAFRRAGIPLAFSKGFNPHPLLSFATALSTGASSDGEWFDLELTEPMEPEAFVSRVNGALPTGLFLSDAFVAPEGFGSLAAKMLAADYHVVCTFDRPVTGEALEGALAALLSGEIIINKRTKGGVKPVDIRPEIQRVFVTGIEGNTCTLRVLGRLQADGGLRVERLLDALSGRLDAQYAADIHRTALYFAGDGPLPRLPQD